MISEMLPGWLLATSGGLLGAVLASFFTVVGERRATGESLGGRSHCTCGRQLTWWENIPVVGWLAAGGRTRCCQERLPAVYLAAEAGSAALAALSAALWGPAGLVVALAVSQPLVAAASYRTARRTRSSRAS